LKGKSCGAAGGLIKSVSKGLYQFTPCLSDVVKTGYLAYET